jgi:hypothetical protein
MYIEQNSDILQIGGEIHKKNPITIWIDKTTLFKHKIKQQWHR